jgi:hypothetical protein
MVLQYDRVFLPAAAQEDVFEECQPLVTSVLDGCAAVRCAFPSWTVPPVDGTWSVLLLEHTASGPVDVTDWARQVQRVHLCVRPDRLRQDAHDAGAADGPGSLV